MEWRKVEDFENYEVSNTGVVRSIKTRNYLKPNVTNGYCYVRLSRDGNTKTRLIHRLVAQSFIDNRDGKPFVLHINGLTKDNNVNNLKWCSKRFELSKCNEERKEIEWLHCGCGNLYQLANADQHKKTEKHKIWECLTQCSQVDSLPSK